MTSAAELHRSSILVVDDERAIADTLAQILHLSGYAAVPAYSGETAIASALRTPPELLIVDIVMRAYSLLGSTAAISLQNGPNRSRAN
jgi:two-component system response regulator MprA